MLAERCAHTSRRAKRIKQRCESSVVLDPAILEAVLAQTLRADMGFAIGAVGPFWLLALALALPGRVLDVPALAHVEVGADCTSSFRVGVTAVVLVLLDLLVLGSSPLCPPA